MRLEVTTRADEARRALERALGSLGRVTRPDGGPVAGQAAIVRTACLDAHDVLAALECMLLRPLADERAVGLRRMIEAGLTQAAECAAACRALGDRDGAIDAVAEQSERVATVLRSLLTELVDDTVEERSSAT